MPDVGDRGAVRPSAPIVLAGAFPPPLTGMTLATGHLHRLLGGDDRVCTVPFAAGRDWRPEERLSVGRVKAVYRYARDIEQASPRVLVYANLSGSRAGHLRDLYTMRASKACGAHVVAWLHNGNFSDHFESVYRRGTVRWLVRQLNIVVVISDILRRKLAPFLPVDRLEVIPNTVDEEIYCTREEVARAQARRAGRGGPLRVIYVSNMLRSKGYTDLLDAVAALRNDDVSLEVDYVGRWMARGDERRFAERVKHRGLQACVRVHGAIEDRAQLRGLLLDGDVFVLPTFYEYEASPMCLIEAFNAGLPVVATRHAGIPDAVIHNLNGRFVEMRNPGSIAAALRKVVDLEYRIRLGNAARRSFEDKFSPAAVKQRWDAVLRRALVEHGDHQVVW